MNTYRILMGSWYGDAAPKHYRDVQAATAKLAPWLAALEWARLTGEALVAQTDLPDRVAPPQVSLAPTARNGNGSVRARLVTMGGNELTAVFYVDKEADRGT